MAESLLPARPQRSKGGRPPNRNLLAVRSRFDAARDALEPLRVEFVAADWRPSPALERARSNCVHLAFTGFLSSPRGEAIRAARRAGAIVHSAPSTRTTVVVRGRPNVQQAAGRDGGLKLMEIKRLREKGYRITLLGEAKFWALVGRGAPTGRASARTRSGRVAS